MIGGSVDADLNPVIILDVIGITGPQPIDVIIDTGFSGFLTLPPATVAALGLAWLGRV
jgi:predicted aspartyl protease